MMWPMGNAYIHLPRGVLRAGALLAVLGLPLVPLAAGAADVEEVVRRNEPAAVVVLGEKPGGRTVQGSGCFVDGDGKVLTSLHQVDGLKRIQILLHDGTRRAASILAQDNAHDVALLKTGANPPRWAAAGDAAALKNGTRIIAIAAPENLRFSTVVGIVSNTNRTYKGMRVIQSDLPAEPGSSGGPVFDDGGALIGIIIGRLENQQWVTVVNPLNNAYPLLASNGVPVPGLPPKGLPALAAGEDEIVPAPGITDLQREAIEVYNRGVAASSAEEKIEAYKTAATLLPEFYEAWFNLAAASTAANQPAKAVTAYRIAERLRPDAVEVPHNLGRVFLNVGRYEEAAVSFTRAVELAPHAASARNDLGETYRRMGRLDEARAAFESALQLDARYAPALYNLALVCVAAGDHAEAAKHLRAYLAAEPDAADAAQVQRWLKDLEGEKK